MMRGMCWWPWRRSWVPRTFPTYATCSGAQHVCSALVGALPVQHAQVGAHTRLLASTPCTLGVCSLNSVFRCANVQRVRDHNSCTCASLPKTVLCFPLLTQTCTRVPLCLCSFACRCVLLHVYVHACTSVCMSVRVCVCALVHLCIDSSSNWPPCQQTSTRHLARASGACTLCVHLPSPSSV